MQTYTHPKCSDLRGRGHLFFSLEADFYLLFVKFLIPVCFCSKPSTLFWMTWKLKLGLSLLSLACEPWWCAGAWGCSWHHCSSRGRGASAGWEPGSDEPPTTLCPEEETNCVCSWTFLGCIKRSMIWWFNSGWMLYHSPPQLDRWEKIQQKAWVEVKAGKGKGPCLLSWAKQTWHGKINWTHYESKSKQENEN